MTAMTEQDQKQAQFDEFFGAFKQRLTDDHRGNNGNRAGTNVPSFLVQREVTSTGIDPRNAQGLCLVDTRGRLHFDPAKTWKDLAGVDVGDDVFTTHLGDEQPELTDAMQERGIKCFSEASESDQWKLLSRLDGVKFVTGYIKQWQTVKPHLTYESAVEMQRRLRLDLGHDSVRIFVESMYDCPEYIQLVNAIMDGRLVPASQ